MHEENSFGVGNDGNDVGAASEPAETSAERSSDQPALGDSEPEAQAEDGQAVEVEQTEPAQGEEAAPKPVKNFAFYHEGDFYVDTSLSDETNFMQLIKAGEQLTPEQKESIIQAAGQDFEEVDQQQALAELEKQRDHWRMHCLQNQDKLAQLQQRFSEEQTNNAILIGEIEELRSPSHVYHDRVEELIKNLAITSPDAPADDREPPAIEQGYQVTSNAVRHAIAVLSQAVTYFDSPGSLNFLPDHPVRKKAEYLLEFLTCPPIDAHLAPEVRRHVEAPEA